MKKWLYTLALVLAISSAAQTRSGDDCIGDFNQDWAYCESLTCTLWEMVIESPAVCAARVSGCQDGAMDRYNRCSIR